MRFSLLIIACTGLLVGVFAQFALDEPELAEWSFIAGALPVLLALVLEIVRSLRAGEIGLDIVAALSMSAALIFGESMAAAVVALMYAGGQYLESYADGRARREMTALLSRVPKTAMRYEQNGALQETSIESITPGTRLLIRSGDIVAVDGTVASGVAVLDESSLTGESLPVKHGEGELLMSGSANVGDAFDLLCTHSAADSTYTGIVRLVEVAQQAKAPMSRMADRYSLVFLGLTLAITAVAWILSSDPIRAVAVLVVATPCPLILAVPVALSAGLSRAATMGVLIKGGKVLERMAELKTIVMDKTGTLTHGKARLHEIETLGSLGEEEVLRLAASLEQASRHPMARQIVGSAVERKLSLQSPEQVKETPGEGIAGIVDGHHIQVGQREFVMANASGPVPNADIAVAVDGHSVGGLQLKDGVRDDVQSLLAELRQAGIERIVVATGDRQDIATDTLAHLGIDELYAELTPEGKSELVSAESRRAPTLMIGDGVNDAPALAIADVGVAMGVHGSAASAETADVVLLVDRISALGAALKSAHRTRSIAFQSVVLGIGLSVAGMLAAAFGYLTPVQGALLQELIDVAAILNALRALRPG